MFHVTLLAFIIMGCILIHEAMQKGYARIGLSMFFIWTVTIATTFTDKTDFLKEVFTKQTTVVMSDRQ